MDRSAHWDAFYGERGPEDVSWYQKDPRLSLELIRESGVGPEQGIIDVGAGASVLIDRLLKLGYRDLTVLDVSATAIELARSRLGEKADRIRWVREDVTRFAPKRTYDLWHDRAVFHFLVEEADRAAYVAALARALRPGGWVIIASFSLQGPETCSGLPVRRYSADLLSRELGAGYRLVRTAEESHATPWETTQEFLYCLFQKT